MSDFLNVKVPTNPWMVWSLIFLAAVMVAYGLSIAIVWAVRRIGRRPMGEFDARIERPLERYLFPLLVVGILLLIVDAVPLPGKVLAAGHRLLALFGILLGFFFSTRLVLLILRNMESRSEAVRNIRGPIEIFVKIIIFAVCGMLILDNLGVSLTPIITTLGIGSLAVAIALQDTLGNFFAGLHIKADRPIQIGHYIRLESGEEGYVEHIGWRSTKVRMLPNNMVVVPNNKLVQSIITNYYLPEKELAVLVQVGVHYDGDLEKVERVTCEVAREVLKTVPGGVASFEPFIRYHTFNQSSIDFNVVLRAREFTDGFVVKHEFIKRLQARYAKEGIIIPFPIRTVHLRTEPEDKSSEEKSTANGPAR